MTDLGPESGIPTPFTFDDIQWRGEPGLRDTQLWERNLDVIRLLLENGTPTKVIDNDYASGIPHAYDMDGLSVEFLPHWGFYKVGDINFSVPEDEEMLMNDVAAAMYVASRQPQ